jgi:NTE family protein
MPRITFSMGYRLPLAFITLLLVFVLAAPGQSHAGQAVRPKVGLALSGGGARGLAHIGVLRVLEKVGLPVDFIAGTSMGSIVGGLYAAGYTPDQITELVKQIDWKEVFSSKPSRRLLRYDKKLDQEYLLEVGLDAKGVKLPAGILSGYKLSALLNGICLPVAHIRDFNQLSIPYRAVATDIVSGDTVILDGGSLAEAMRISMAVPGIFPPYQYKGRLLVDGGIVQNLPVQTVRDLGADVVIAVDVSTPLRTKDNLKNFIQVLDQTMAIQMIRSTKEQARLADLVIRPDLEKYASGDFEKSRDIEEAGLAAGKAMAVDMKKLARAKGIPLKSYKRQGLKPVHKLVVAGISLAGPETYKAELKRMAPFKPGQPITTAQLDDAVQKLYGLGTVAYVSYEVLPEKDGRSQVIFKLEPKRLGEVSGRMRLRMGINSERTNPLELGFRFRRDHLFLGDSYSELNIIVGRSSGGSISTTFNNRPFNGFFLQPELFYWSKLHDLYQNREIKAEYSVDRWGLGLHSGIYLGTEGKLSLSYLLMKETVDPRIVTVNVNDIENRLAGLRASLILDTLDRAAFPRRGFTTDLAFTRMLRSLGSDADFNRLRWDGSLIIPLSDKHLLRPNWSLASSFDTNPPFSQAVYLGGYEGMWGYAYEEFFGQELGRFQLMYRYRVMPWLYLRLAGNVGGVWDSLEQAREYWDRLIWGGGVGFGADTPLGPLEFALGWGEAGRFNAYLTFGYSF